MSGFLSPSNEQAELQAEIQRNAKINKYKYALAESQSTNQQLAEKIARIRQQINEKKEKLRELEEKTKNILPEAPSRSEKQQILKAPSRLEERIQEQNLKEQIRELKVLEEQEQKLKLKELEEPPQPGPPTPQPPTFGRQTPELLRGVSFKYENEKYKLYPQVSNQQGEPLTFQEDQLDQCSDENCFTFKPRTDESLLAKYFLSLFFSNKYTEIKAVLEDNRTENLSEYQQKISETYFLIKSVLITNTDNNISIQRDKKLTFIVASIFYARENDIKEGSGGYGQRRLLDRNEINKILLDLFKRSNLFINDGDSKILANELIKLYTGEEIIDTITGPTTTTLTNEENEQLPASLDDKKYEWTKYLPNNLNFAGYDLNNSINKKVFEILYKILNNYNESQFNTIFDTTETDPIVTFIEATSRWTEGFEEEIESPLSPTENEVTEFEQFEDEEMKETKQTEQNGGAFPQVIDNFENFNEQILMIKYKETTDSEVKVQFVVPFINRDNKLILSFENFYNKMSVSGTNELMDLTKQIEKYFDVKWFTINLNENFQKLQTLQTLEENKINQEEIKNRLEAQEKTHQKNLEIKKQNLQQVSLVSQKKTVSQESKEKPPNVIDLTNEEITKIINSNESENVSDSLDKQTNAKTKITKNELLRNINSYSDETENNIYNILFRKKNLSNEEQAFIDYYDLKNIDIIFNNKDKTKIGEILHLLFDNIGTSDYKTRIDKLQEIYGDIDNIKRRFFNKKEMNRNINSPEIRNLINSIDTNNSYYISLPTEPSDGFERISGEVFDITTPTADTPSKKGGNKLTKTYRNFPTKKSIPLFNTRRNLDSTTPTPIKLYAHINKKRFTRNKKRAHKKTQRSP